VEPTFGDRVRIAESPETEARGFAGRTGHVYGQSVPSASGAGPVIGDRGEDFALSVFFEETQEEEWFAPHLVQLVDHGGPQTVTIEGGPSFVRDADGTWREVGGPTEFGDFLNPGRRVERAASEPSQPAGRIRRWFRRQRA
jgi:hypothetical protein